MNTVVRPLSFGHVDITVVKCLLDVVQPTFFLRKTNSRISIKKNGGKGRNRTYLAGLRQPRRF